jgi:hypothetical protein
MQRRDFNQHRIGPVAYWAHPEAKPRIGMLFGLNEDTAGYALILLST